MSGLDFDEGDFMIGQVRADTAKRLQEAGRLEDAGWALIQNAIFLALKEPPRLEVSKRELRRQADEQQRFFRSLGIDLTDSKSLLALLYGAQQVILPLIASHRSGDVTVSRRTVDASHTAFALICLRFEHLMPRWVKEGNDPPNMP